MFVVYGARIVKIILTTTLVFYLVLFIEGESKRSPSCWRGTFNSVTGDCSCYHGWYGKTCQNTRQRLKASSGIISDIPGEYGYSSKCLWIITAEWPNSVIQLSVEQYSSQSSKCTWYTLYMYNGHSFKAPLLAVFSGITRDNSSVTTLTSTSSTVLIYFFRDPDINLHSGFKIKYSIIKNCSLLCSFHGNCDTLGKCICSSGWTGPTCNISVCPYPCIHGTCSVATWQCDCNLGFSGPSCNTSTKYGTWNKHIATNQGVAQGRVAHGAGVIGDWLWVHGGYSLVDKPFHNLIRYGFSRNTWEVVSFSNSFDPGNRYGHSLVVYNNSLIIFGGISKGRTVNEVWSFNVITRQWTKVQLSKDSTFPIAVSGHTATIVNTKMIVLFGYGPLFGFTPYIQVYDIGTKKWKIINSTLKEPTYGHTSHYDPVTKLIYIHGGRTQGGYSSAVHSYDPMQNLWTPLSSSRSVHLLHSSVLIGHMMIVYGGYTFIDGLKYAKCYDTDFMVYDIICDKWSKIPPTNLPPLSGRFGHAAVVYNSKMYIFGGFNGIMKNDVLSYSLGNCSLRRDKISCLSVNSISGCLWDSNTKTCIGPEKGFSQFQILKRPSCAEYCNRRSSCGSCNAPGVDCKWCDARCRKTSEKCIQPPSKNCQFIIEVLNYNPGVVEKPVCKGPVCHNMLPYKNRNTCMRCTKRPSQTKESDNTIYMWCSAERKCIDTESYSALLPIRQCNNWIFRRCQDVQCSVHTSCNSCLSTPGCGWCDDDSDTGVGRCMEGGADSPYYSAGSKICPRWYFENCPACQCNGHSICMKTSKTCSNCKHHTIGMLCQRCKAGYFGNPRNGGTCRECECNGHAKYCHLITSKCVCLIEGISGDKCEICDKDYEGNATNGKMCYYKLSLSSRKIFNVSGKTGINIQFTPFFKERDLSFDIEVVSGKAVLMNITYVKELSKYRNKEVPIFKRKELGRFENKFSHREYSFHKGQITFRAYIYNMDMDKGDSVQIIAHFDQPSTLNINLLEFFLTFFGCFLSLLFVASIGWRIRSRYHTYLVTRQRRAERDRMANRPFATVHLLLPNELEVLSKSSPSVIAVEPLLKNKVAIATVVVLLPDGEEGVPPVGQCGVCFGSMMMSHASHQHMCIRSRMGRKKTKKRSTMTTYHL